MRGVTVTIERRFNGPPGSGHGGWSAGLSAGCVDAACAQVTLRSPPPLATPLAVSKAGGGGAVALHAGDTLVMEAEPATLDLDPPAPVEPDVAAAASAQFAWAHGHPFPGCFGCGPDRDPADALRLFCGPVGDGRFAVPWTPAPWTGTDVVAPGYVWAALDCPSSAPVHGSIAAPIVLGRLTVALEAPVAVGAPHVIQSWLEEAEGRRRTCGVALFDAAGARLAAGRAVWIELARPLGA